MSFNKIIDISPLILLKKFDVVNLSFNQITEVSALRSIEKLSELYLSANYISDLSPVQQYSDIDEFEIEGQQEPPEEILLMFNKISKIHSSMKQLHQVKKQITQNRFRTGVQPFQNKFNAEMNQVLN
ncbi:leucine-rich_repeat domain-containing protein [Hexamita inflata]|uniref:Leucine-rich repeat domain-containing protein n=1 Tax=Hexamita inflata TaxID=28002 RepID=A0AA86Q9X3_9EUKA|nr:leucine-rich repeat domain-containing protein [Hexamita inflata]